MTKISSNARGPKVAPISIRPSQVTHERRRAEIARAIGTPTKIHPTTENIAYIKKISNACANSRSGWPVWALSNKALQITKSSGAALPAASPMAAKRSRQKGLIAAEWAPWLGDSCLAERIDLNMFKAQYVLAGRELSSSF